MSNVTKEELARLEEYLREDKEQPAAFVVMAGIARIDTLESYLRQVCPYLVDSGDEDAYDLAQDIKKFIQE